MKEFTIKLPGNPKAELHLKLKKIIGEYNSEIMKNNVKIIQSNDVYNIHADKNVMFVNYYVNAEVVVFDNYLQVKYDTNAPDLAAKNTISNFMNGFIQSK